MSQTSENDVGSVEKDLFSLLDKQAALLSYSVSFALTLIYFFALPSLGSFWPQGRLFFEAVIASTIPILLSLNITYALFQENVQKRESMQQRNLAEVISGDIDRVVSDNADETERELMTLSGTISNLQKSQNDSAYSLDTISNFIRSNEYQNRQPGGYKNTDSSFDMNSGLPAVKQESQISRKLSRFSNMWSKEDD